MVAEEATLRLHVARGLFADRISYSRIAYRIRAAHSVFPYRAQPIRVSHIAFARHVAYSHSRGPKRIRIAYHIRATHSVLHIAYHNNRAVHGIVFLSKCSLSTRPLSDLGLVISFPSYLARAIADLRSLRWTGSWSMNMTHHISLRELDG